MSNRLDFLILKIQKIKNKLSNFIQIKQLVQIYEKFYIFKIIPKKTEQHIFRLSKFFF